MKISLKSAAYGAHPRQKLDIYRPVGSGDGAPILFFLYGGAWKSGQRAYYRPLGRALAGEGYVCVISDYRLSPEVRFPSFNQDAAAALGWVTANAKACGGDPDRIAVFGHSAGAHIGALLSLDASYLDQLGVPTDCIKRFAGLAGPYGADLISHGSTTAIFLNAKDPDTTRPLKLVGQKKITPAMLLLHGAKDKTVNVQNSTAFAQAIQKKGGHAEVAIYPNLGHIDILITLARPFRWRAPVWQNLLDFFADL